MIDTNRYVSNSGELRLMNNLNRIFKNFESFVQNSMHLAAMVPNQKMGGGGTVGSDFE